MTPQEAWNVLYQVASQINFTIQSIKTGEAVLQALETLKPLEPTLPSLPVD